MTALPMPVELMTAAERAGFRVACAHMRDRAAQVRRGAAALPVATTDQMLRRDLLDACGRMAALVADQTEALLGRSVTLHHPQQERH